MNPPDSLLDPDLTVVWHAVRDRLERRGLDNRGRVRIPDVPSRGRLALGALLGRAPGATLDLARLEASLVGLGVGVDLPAALDALGHAPSGEPARRRARRESQRAAHDAARRAAGAWPEEWAAEWVDSVIRAGGLGGLDAPAAVELVDAARRVLDELHPTDAPFQSRVELSARLLGDSHALDTGSRLEAAVTRALALRFGPNDARSLWEQAGVHLDLVSGAALTWRLPVGEDTPLGRLAAVSTDAGLPLHVTQLALRQHPIEVLPGTDVLVVENPRIVEAAAQLRAPVSIIATNGNPSITVQLLIRRLRDSGAALRYHGDFDGSGLAICRRLHAEGVTPWRMGVADYLGALSDAESSGIELPLDVGPPGPTPWEPQLEDVVAEHRRVVHEERLLPLLLRLPTEFDAG